MLGDREYMGNDRGFLATSSAVKVLIYVNVGVFLLTYALRLLPDAPFLLSAYGVRNLELWRLGTYMFLHANVMHLAFNMFALYVFGHNLEERLGRNRFLQLYFVSGLSGAAVWLLFNWSSPTYVLGASGAVFGVMMAAALMFPNRVIVLLFPPIPMRLKTLVAVFALIEVFMLMGRGDGGIAHLAHLGGLLGGFLCMHHYYRRRASSGSPLLRLRSWWRQRQASERRRRFTISKDDDDDSDLSNDPTFKGPVSAEVDGILDKIGRYGIHSLNSHERQVLEDARQRLRDRHRS